MPEPNDTAEYVDANTGEIIWVDHFVNIQGARMVADEIARWRIASELGKQDA